MTNLFNNFIFVNIILLIIIYTLLLILKIYYPKLRGFMGEFWVKLELEKLPLEKYYIINDLMVKVDDKTHQFDHIVLSKFGIFVIEMKNYMGLIKGNDFDNKWCQYLKRKKHYFYNPVHQNYGHVKVLSSILELDEINFISIICFSNQATLKVTSKNILAQTGNIASKIINYEGSEINYDMIDIYQKLVSKNIIDRKSRKNHSKVIKKRILETKMKVDSMICPQCGNMLVERKGKYQTFIGCSSFPKCRFIKK